MDKKVLSIQLTNGTGLMFGDAEVLLDARENTLTVYRPDGDLVVFPWTNVQFYALTAPAAEDESHERAEREAAEDWFLGPDSSE